MQVVLPGGLKKCSEAQDLQVFEEGPKQFAQELSHELHLFVSESP